MEKKEADQKLTIVKIEVKVVEEQKEIVQISRNWGKGSRSRRGRRRRKSTTTTSTSSRSISVVLVV